MLKSGSAQAMPLCRPKSLNPLYHQKRRGSVFRNLVFHPNPPLPLSSLPQPTAKNCTAPSIDSHLRPHFAEHFSMVVLEVRFGRVRSAGRAEPAE